MSYICIFYILDHNAYTFLATYPSQSLCFIPNEGALLKLIVQESKCYEILKCSIADRSYVSFNCIIKSYKSYTGDDNKFSNTVFINTDTSRHKKAVVSVPSARFNHKMHAYNKHPVC